MILEGVFVGNQGPIYYEATEIAKSVNAWNNRPITIGHPEDSSGRKVSGCQPESIDRYSVGMVLNTHYNQKTGKLRAEAWFEESRLQEVPGANQILQALEKGTPLEVSTGLFVDNKSEVGTFRGKTFSSRATNFRPDHLAIILNGQGACSLKDGAGLLVNKNEDPVGKAHYVLDGIEYVENFTLNEGQVKLLGNREKVSKETTPPNTETVQVLNEKVKMSKEQLLKAMGDSHKDFVESLDEAQVTAILGLEKTVTVEVPVTNQAASVEELLKMATPAVADQIQQALVVNQNHRQSLIEQIVANEKNAFSADELNGMATDVLDKLAVLAVNAKPEPAPAAKAPQYVGSPAAPASTSAKKVEGFLPKPTFVPVKG